MSGVVRSQHGASTVSGPNSGNSPVQMLLASTSTPASEVSDQVDTSGAAGVGNKPLRQRQLIGRRKVVNQDTSDLMLTIARQVSTHKARLLGSGHIWGDAAIPIRFVTEDDEIRGEAVLYFLKELDHRESGVHYVLPLARSILDSMNIRYRELKPH
jgi:hypothetical protein